MSEERFVDIESKLAHQEQLLMDLNDVVTQQQATLMRLDELSRSLIDRVRSISDDAIVGEAGDERPPHY
jgi:SlyX protein